MASTGSGDSITKQDKASSTFVVKEVKETTIMSQSQKNNRRVISVPSDVQFIQPGGQALNLSDVVAAENKAGAKEQEGSASRVITSSETASQEEKTTGPQHELSQSSLPESSSSAVADADAADVTGAIQNSHVARSLTGSLTVAATPVSITSDSIPAVAATAAPGAAGARPFKQSSATSATSSSSTSSRTRFPDKLHRLLDHCSNDPVECRFVSWMGNRAFKVHEPKQFASNILPRYFSTTTYKSFQRNLNLWGFTCIAKGPRRGVTFHPFFVRGNEDDLSSHMKRSGDPTKMLQQRDQKLLLNSIVSSSATAPPVVATGTMETGTVTSATSAALSALNPAAGNTISALSALAGQFPPLGFSASTAAANMAPPQSGTFRALGAMSAAVHLAADGAAIETSKTDDRPSSETKQETAGKRKKRPSDIESSPPIRKRKASSKKKRGPKSDKDDASKHPPPLPGDQQAQTAMLQRILGGEEVAQTPTADGSDRSSVDGGVNIRQLLAMSGQSSHAAAAGSSAPVNIQQLVAMARANEAVGEAVNPALARTNAATEGLQQLLQQTQTNDVSTDIQRLLALSRAGAGSNNLALQHLLSGVRPQTSSLMDTSQSSHMGGAGSALSPHLALLLRQQQLSRQLQQETWGENSNVAELLAALQSGGSQQHSQNRNEALLQQLEELQKQESEHEQKSLFDQQVAQQQQALEQAMQVVQQQQQKLLALQHEQDRRRQLQQLQQAPNEMSLEQLLQQLQGGSSVCPPPLQLPPSAIPLQRQQQSPTSAAAAAAAASNPSIEQLTQLLLSRQQALGMGELASTGAVAASGQPSSQLQQLLQSLGDGTSASATGIAVASPASLLDALQQQQQQQQQQKMSESSRPTPQDFLQLLQARQKAEQAKFATYPMGPPL